MSDGERERPNWVEARAYCTLEDAFGQIVNAIKQDVDCFNGMPADKRKYCRISWECHEDHVVFTRHGDDPKPLKDDVSVHLDDKDIEIRHNNALQFRVVPRWSEPSFTCQLTIQGREQTLPTISQKAIGDLLFPRR